MFGKARDINDTDTLDSSALDEFFGDEAAAENTVGDSRPARPCRTGRVADQQPVHVARHLRADRPGAGRARPLGGQGRNRALRTAPHLADRARARRPHHLLHRRRPRGIARPDLTSRRARAFGRPHPEGPRRLPSAAEGPRHRDHHDVRTPHCTGPHRSRSDRARRNGQLRRLRSPPPVSNRRPPARLRTARARSAASPSTADPSTGTRVRAPRDERSNRIRRFGSSQPDPGTQR